MQKILQQLQWALQALAQPAKIQIKLYPHFVCAADELALEYNNYLAAALADYPEQFTPNQVHSLQSVDALLSQMSAEENGDHWTDEALLSDANWADVRIRAEHALKELRWAKDIPPIDPKERGADYQPGNEPRNFFLPQSHGVHGVTSI